MHSRTVIVASLLSFAAASVAAQEAAPPPPNAAAPLPLAQALAEVAATHPDLVGARKQFEADRLMSASERFLMPPMLEARADEWPFDTVNPSNAKLMVMIGQEIPGRGKRAARAALADREASMSGAEIGVREQDLFQRVRRAYADLQVARATLDTYRDTIDLLREIIDAAEARYIAGQTGQGDVLDAVLERSMLEEQIVMTDERARMAESTLNVLLGRDPAAPVGPLDALAHEISVPAPADLQRLASHAQPEFAVFDATTAQREAQLALARTERRPDFIVQGGYMAMPNMTDAWTARFSLTWPGAPWARGRNDALERAAQAQVDAARSRRQVLETSVKQMVQEAWIQADAAAKRATLLRTSVIPQAQHALEIARGGYQVNRVGFIDILDNERRLLQARVSVLEAIGARDRALADLARAVGVPVEPGTASLKARSDR